MSSRSDIMLTTNWSARGLLRVWSDGDALDGDVSLAFTAALGLAPEALMVIKEQIEEDPGEVGIEDGMNRIYCRGFVDDLPLGYFDLARVSMDEWADLAREILPAVVAQWSGRGDAAPATGSVSAMDEKFTAGVEVSDGDVTARFAPGATVVTICLDGERSDPMSMTALMKTAFLCLDLFKLMNGEKRHADEHKLTEEPKHEE